MRLLLDTHVALRALVDSPRRSAAARDLLLEFDRLLVAQALVEPFRLPTADATVSLYGGGILRV